MEGTGFNLDRMLGEFFWPNNDEWHGRSLFTPLDGQDTFCCNFGPLCFFFNTNSFCFTSLLLYLHFLDMFFFDVFWIDILSTWYGFSWAGFRFSSDGLCCICYEKAVVVSFDRYLWQPGINQRGLPSIIFDACDPESDFIL